jgi:PAS domain S-box-containing protein
MSKILIADDISENRYLLAVLFGSLGDEVVSAQNGAEALGLALSSPPDVIITDILMPVMDGFELCRRWKSDERLKRVPFIFYTATYTDPKDERFALGLGAERFVIKPQKPDTLVQLVREVLEQSAPKENADLANPLGEEMEVLRQYNEVLFRKLERKVLQLQVEITERSQVQAAYEEGRARLLEAHRLAHIGTWDWDADTDRVEWSEELYRIAGIEPTGPAPSYADHPKIYAPESWKCLQAAVESALRTAEPYHLELEMIRPDGTRRWVNALGGPRRDVAGRVVGLHGMVQDVTEQKRAEEERRKLEEHLRVAQKMEAIGTLAGGIAHDFNNILAAVTGYVELALQVSTSEEQREYLQNVMKASSRAIDLVKQILTFSRMRTEEAQPIQPKLIVKEAMKLLRASIPTTIEIRQNLVSSATVMADPGAIHRIVVNLCTNAALAMEEKGGFLEVTLDEVDLDGTFVMEHPGLSPGRHVRLSVEDSGCGMTEEVQTRMFEPFFTTRAEGKGTGLGLSVVHGIVKSLGGALSVASTPGEGTTFHIFLPAEEKGVVASEEAVEIPVMGSERVLFVDDEPMVASLAARSLSRLGYRVTSVSDSREALKLFEEAPNDFDLVVTDMTMPNMSGQALAEAVKLTRPGMPVILCTGHRERIADAEAKAPGVEGFILKPVSAVRLSTIIQRVLNQGK